MRGGRGRRRSASRRRPSTASRRARCRGRRDARRARPHRRVPAQPALVAALAGEADVPRSAGKRAALNPAVGTGGVAGTAPASVVPPVDIVVPVYGACDDLVPLRRQRARAHPGRLSAAADRRRVARSADRRLFRRAGRAAAAATGAARQSGQPRFHGHVDRGIAVGGPAGGDVVLLNSDAVVTEGWLDALLRCAGSSPHIGTITPFSNNAEICSFPVFCADNRWADGADPEPVRRALARSAVPERVRSCRPASGSACSSAAS